MLQADAEKTEVEEVTRPGGQRASETRRRGRTVKGRVPHLVTTIPIFEMDYLFLESHGPLDCYVRIDSHLILAFDSKSVQCVCDIDTLRGQYFYISIYRLS